MPNTIKDVARLAGVAVSTASVALRGKGHVGKETRRRVLQAARDLNYRPNRFAQSLVTRETALIGVILSDLADPATAEFFRGAHSIASEYGYALLPRLTYGSGEREKAALNEFRADRAEGVLVFDGRAPRPVPGARDVEEDPVVVHVGAVRGQGPSVRLAEADAVRQLVAHLVGLGHTRIACLPGPRESRRSHARAVGYRLALRGGPCPFLPGLLCFLPPDGAVAGQVAVELFRQEPPPTAVVVGHEVTALGVLAALHDLGLRVPADVSVAAVGGGFLLSHLRPPLTRVAFPFYEAGRRAARLLLAHIRRQAESPEEEPVVEVAGTLVPGESTGPCPGAANGLRPPQPVEAGGRSG